MKPLCSLAAAAISLGGVGSIQADVISFQQGVSPTPAYTHHDAQVRNDAANAGTPSNTGINVVGWTGGSSPVTLRSINSWDLSAIPEGATIVSVTLTVGNRSDTGTSIDDMNNVVDENDPLVELRTISQSFNEATATWNNTFGSSMTLGADVLSSARFDPEIGGTMSYSTFASSDAFVAAVQAAVDSPGNLFNYALLLANESGSDRVAIQVGSNNATGTTVPAPPVLTIEYVVPEPASLGLLALGGGLVLGRRR